MLTLTELTYYRTVVSVQSVRPHSYRLRIAKGGSHVHNHRDARGARVRARRPAPQPGNDVLLPPVWLRRHRGLHRRWNLPVTRALPRRPTVRVIAGTRQRPRGAARPHPGGPSLSLAASPAAPLGRCLL